MNTPCSPRDALSPLRNDPPKREIILEFEKNASGYFWRLRAAGKCIARAARDYESIEAMNADLRRVSTAIKFAKHVWLTNK